MAKTVNRQGSLNTKINLKGFENYIEELKYLASGDILRRAASHLQERAFLAMKRKYFQTKSNRIYYNKKYLSKGKDKSIESRLFDSKLSAPTRNGKYSYSFRFWPGYTELRNLPHLKWQEKGTSAMIDTQPYEITSSKSLGPITKRRAISRAPIGTRKKERYRRSEIGGFIELQVPHPGLKARGFIAAGNLYIKTQAQTDLVKFLKKELAKRKSNA